MADTPRLIERRAIYAGKIFDVTADRVELPGGRDVTLEIVRHPGSVVLVPMPDADHVTLVRQYRHAIERWIWELPAGSLEPGEDPAAAARRECHEEIGLVPNVLEPLGTYFPTPGFCSEFMTFFRLLDLQTPSAPAAQDEDEQIEPRTFSLAEAMRMIASGEICDMKTVVGLTLIENA
jgi:ADP-ribose pyrophosphatase